MKNQTPPTTQANTSVVAPTKKPIKPYGRNWKKLLLVYLIIAAVIYGAAYYFVVSKPTSKPYSQPVAKPTTAPSTNPDTDPPVNWKTYTSQTDKYSIRYPSTWKIRKENSNGYIYIESPDYEGTTKGMSMSIRISDTDKADIEEWFTDFRARQEAAKDTMGYERISEDTIKRTIISETAAIQYDSAMQSSSVNTVFIKNKKLFSIGYLWTNKQLRDADEELFNQVLQTFKFAQ